MGADTPTESSDGAGPAQKPVSPAHLTVLVLFAIGVLAIPAVVIAGAIAGFDALWFALGIGAGCLILAFLWTYTRDTVRWVGATARLARTSGLVRTRIPAPGDGDSATPAAEVADDDRRLDRRRVTRLVAEAQRKDPKLKQRQPPPE